jgi:hypothetical protein
MDRWGVVWGLLYVRVGDDEHGVRKSNSLFVVEFCFAGAGCLVGGGVL